MLERGVQVSTMGSSPEDKEGILRIQAKMNKNLEMARERVKVLGIIV